MSCSPTTEQTAAHQPAGGNPDLKDAMGRAGVPGPPRIEIFDEVEAVQY